MGPKESANRRVSASTTAPIAPRTRSSHMNQKRCCPGVPNRYRISSESSVTRPKSIATVVVTLPGVAPRSSIPVLASVITASVVNGMISETEPTNVVLPTPKPPATTIFAEVAARPSGVRFDLSKSTESTQHPFHQHEMLRDVVVGECPVNADQALFGHVAQDNSGHTERNGQLGRDLGHRQRIPAQCADRPVLQLEQSGFVLAEIRGGDQRLQFQIVVRPCPAACPRVRTDHRGGIGEIIEIGAEITALRPGSIIQPGRSDRTAQPAETTLRTVIDNALAAVVRGIIPIHGVGNRIPGVRFAAILRDEFGRTLTTAGFGETFGHRDLTQVATQAASGAESSPVVPPEAPG